jgi:hypothetical protein
MLSSDFKEFAGLFNASGAEYLKDLADLESLGETPPHSKRS